MIVYTNYISISILFFIFFCFYFSFFSLFHLFLFFCYFFDFFHFFDFIYLFLFFLILLYIFIFPYFRGNSLNSRADLEFKEIRLFSTMIFQKKRLKFYVFSKNPNGFFFFHDDFEKKH